MNKKGFMFVETIVMCAILMVALLLIYNSYTSAIAREKERINYNTVAGQYKLIAIKEYLKDSDDKWECVLLSETIECPKINELLDEGNYYDMVSLLPQEVKDTYGVQNLIIAKCNENEYEFIEDNEDFHQYAKTIKSCEDLGKYRFIANFYSESTKSYSYAWLEYPNIGGEDTNE